MIFRTAEQRAAAAIYRLYESGIRGRRTLDYLQEYERQQWLDPAQIERLQLLRLQQLLAHCEAQVPYYRRRWREIGFRAADLTSVEHLAQLPLLTKDDIRAHLGDLIAVNWRGRTLRKATGGSTGQPLAFHYTRESYERRMAVMLRGYAWAGAGLGVRTLHLWGVDVGATSRLQRLKSSLYRGLLRKRVVSSFRMRNDNLEEYLVQIEQWRPEVIVGFVGALEVLARYLADGRALRWRPRSVITAAEMLADWQRALIEQAFGAPVFHTYGCREVMLIGAECEAHRGYHLSADHLVVEVTDDAGARLSDGVGNVVLTDLWNEGMPFVRYANGDLAQAATPSGACSCGRGLPRLGPVEGRRLDLIRTPDGRRIPGEFFPHLMKEVPTVDRFQVRQRQLDQIELLIVPHGEVSAEQLQFIRREIERVAGGSLDVAVRFVTDIPLTASGKRRVTVSELPAEAP
jgi:phenylacetate-CoA ligase